MCSGLTNCNKTIFRSPKIERLNYQSFENHYKVVQNLESYIYFCNYKRTHLTIEFTASAQKWLEICLNKSGHHNLVF